MEDAKKNKTMKDKLLIWEQNYDVCSFYETIDKADLEAYIIHWVAKYLHGANSKGHILHKYISHNVREHGTVDIKFEHFGYRVGETVYPPAEYWDGFSFIDLEKQPTWKP
jgi:hypothetical protein